MVPRPAVVDEPRQPPAAASDPQPARAGEASDGTERLASIARDLDDADRELQQQRGIAERAAGRVAAAGLDEDAWATAQLELTRLDRIGSRIADLRERVDGVAASLGDAGAETAARRTVERLTARLDRLTAHYKTSSEALGAGIAR